MKKVKFLTFGCRLNQYDTQTLRTMLEQDGNWQTVGNKEQADMVVVNTCTVTSRADATARKAIRKLQSSDPTAKVVVTGCYAQRAAEEIAKLPGVALVLGAADRANLLNNIENLDNNRAVIAVSPIEEAKQFIDLPINEMLEHSRAYLKIQEGCNEKCTFCIIPHTRGPSRSRSEQSVVEQAQTLLDERYVELVITGVHAGDFGLDGQRQQRRLSALLQRLIELPKLQRLRLSSIEPASIDDSLIELMASTTKFARHFHIPLQSGSDRILQRMQRRYSANDFIELVEKISQQVPDCGIGTDIICGFPTETDDDFAQTFSLLEQLPIHYAHPFSYSPRPGSAAEPLGDPISGDIKKRRIAAIKRLMRDKSAVFKQAHIGKKMQIISEKGRRAGNPLVTGWTDNYLKVEVDPTTINANTTLAKSGQLLTVNITAMNDQALLGKVA